MKAPLQLLQRWEGLASHGDLKNISIQSGWDVRLIRSCIRGEDVNPLVFQAVADYYNNIANLIKQAMYEQGL